MRISTNWLKDYIDYKGDLKELAQVITNNGVNIESIESTKINNLIIGEILSITKHPDSDHLNVCIVNIGKEELQIVCGASNVRPNLKVIVALDGAVLPGNFVIKKSKIRGIESNGMICALYELGLEEKTEEAYKAGIYELDNSAKIGTDPLDFLELGDVIYNLDLNPNRNDCLSHIGFAYEASAATGIEVKLPINEIKCIKEDINDKIKVEINTKNCTYYSTRLVKDVIIKESPKFIKDRLIACGMRPINNVVDISNYIMLEYGQPLHFFDYDKLGKKLVIRQAKDLEEVITLDNKLRILNEDDIVITNGEDITCIAGVMGAINTGVDNETTNILIESAIFNPRNVRATSLKLNLRSEASIRIEKQLNKDYTALALDRAAYLLNKYASGNVVSGSIIIDKQIDEAKNVDITIDNINSLLGIKLSENDVIESLNKLGFSFKKNNNIFSVNIPSRRMDVEASKADIIEEIGRIYGFDNIKPIRIIDEVKDGKYIDNVYYKKQISKLLRSCGLNETKTYTLISEEEADLFNYENKEVIKLLRPLSNDKNCIRTTVINSLIKVADFNNARGINDINIYEISNTYSKGNIEDTKITILLKGNYLNSEYNNIVIKNDFFILKGILENVLEYMGFKNRFNLEKTEVKDLHKGICAKVTLDKEVIGVIGQVSPKLRNDEIYVLELSLTKIADKKIKPIKYKEFSKYPSVSKDLSFVINNNVTNEEIIKLIQKSGSKLLQNIKLFDIYKIDNNTTSLAYSLTFGSEEKTLTDLEINELLNNIIKSVESSNLAKLRSI